MEEKRQRERSIRKFIDQIRKDTEMREENLEEMQENGKWENRSICRFSVIVDP